MRRKKNQLTFQENKFLNEYLKSGSGLKALSIAYPKSERWTQNTKYSQVHKLLNNPLISIRIKEHNDAEREAIKNSTILNQRKLIESALMILENTQNNPQQYAHAINVLKLLYQQQGMMPKTDNNTTVNIINNNSIENISNFLDL